MSLYSYTCFAHRFGFPLVYNTCSSSYLEPPLHTPGWYTFTVCFTCHSYSLEQCFFLHPTESLYTGVVALVDFFTLVFRTNTHTHLCHETYFKTLTSLCYYIYYRGTRYFKKQYYTLKANLFCRFISKFDILQLQGLSLHRDISFIDVMSPSSA